MPSLETHSIVHPHSDDPSSSNFARQHPRRVRKQEKVFNISDVTGQKYASLVHLNSILNDDRVPDFIYASAIYCLDGHLHAPSDVDTDCNYLVDQVLLLPTYALAVTLTAELGAVIIPKSYRQAMNSPQANYWREAIAKELGGLIALNTWTIIPTTQMYIETPNANLMNCHMVFTVKRTASGAIEKFKCRLVADGNTQKQGIDFDRVFSTVVKMQTIRLVFIIAAARDYNLTSIDIRQAYLQGTLDKSLYMRLPPGLTYNFTVPSVCKLLRSLYGLKQAGRIWSNMFTTYLLSWGFTRSTIDSCLYTYSTGAIILWVLVWVDDAVIVDNDYTTRDRFVNDMSKRFPTEDKGDLQWILNVAVTRDRSNRSITLSQKLYVTDLISKYGASITDHSRKYDTPFPEGVTVDPHDCPDVGSPAHADMASQRDMYMSLVGGYLWLANMTFYQLAYPSSQLARVLSNPGPTHVSLAMRVLTYLHGHIDHVLHFAPNQSTFIVYVDSNWSVTFSVSGAMYFYHGCLFHWFAKTQHSVSLSSAEAEYFGAMLASRDILFLRDVFVELGILFNSPTIIHCDSKSAVGMSFDPVAFKNTKHIMRAAEFLRDLVLKGHVILEHLPGDVMIADILTKAVARAIFIALMDLILNFVNNV
jgi:hypothetical protein